MARKARLRRWEVQLPDCKAIEVEASDKHAAVEKYLEVGPRISRTENKFTVRELKADGSPGKVEAIVGASILADELPESLDDSDDADGS